MLALVKNRLAVKIALTMAIPLLVNFALYGEMQRQLVALERMTAELSVRRQIADRANQIIISNFFALQSLMQYKFFNRDSDKDKFTGHLGQFTSEIQNLANTLKGRPGEEELGTRLQNESREYLASLSLSQFNPDEHNQVGSFFDNLERNQRLKKASVKFMLTLKEVGKKCQEDVDKANSAELQSRAEFRQFCQFTIWANSLVAVCIAFLVGRVMVKRINIVRSNSERLASGQPLLEAAVSGDEIGELDKTFREMASALESAREKEKSMLATIAESRDELEIVINKIPAALFITDGGGKVESLNMVAKTLFSIDQDYFDGSNLAKLFKLKSAEKVDFFKRLSDDAHLKPVQMLALTSIDESVPVNVSVTPFLNAGVTKYLVTLVDETERLILEQAKSDFFNMISHDMRTPLTSISGVLQLAIAGAYGDLPDQTVEKLELARTGSTLLLDMINRLLQIEKMETANLDLTLETFDLSDLVNQADTLVAPQFIAKSITCSISSEKTMVNADKNLLLEVILNLMTNSIKYSPRNGELVLKCHQADSNAMFELIDQGPGIPDDKKARIFDRFAQADAHSDKSTSFGLGLSICRKVIAQHGGSIGVTDAPQGGAIFWFKLPVVADTES
ncbi:MAG: hypothetical protein JST89_00220 [Cyanobacteria bacterium SZAS-4]|nr:hypothetical protein [Cyanobacteria bacterium SZAS-4]